MRELQGTYWDDKAPKLPETVFNGFVAVTATARIPLALSGTPSEALALYGAPIKALFGGPIKMLWGFVTADTAYLVA
jgi:hypothetical protein